MISRFFIDRPVFATVVSLLVFLIGLAAMTALPIAQYPEITPPTVEVSAVYPGASAETVAASVAAPIEQQLSGAKDMIYYASTCTNDGGLRTVVTFEIGTDLDLAAVEVQNRVKLAETSLPQSVLDQGITITKKSSNMLLVAALESSDPRFDDLYLSNYATINVLDSLKRVPGTGDVIVFGAKDYAMRLWVDPDRMTQKQLTVSDIAAAVREQNASFAAGRLGQRPSPDRQSLTIPVITRGRMDDPQQFEDIILRANPDGTTVRFRDIGRAELGAKSYDLAGRLNGRPSTLIIVYLQPGANALATAHGIRSTLEGLSETFPAGITFSIPYDTTLFIEASIEKVIHTFLEAVVLVVLVVFIFLQSWRATIIPLLAVPVAIVGTFAGMLALGFSINTLTLFGMILAIGIVVDDAIVVVENVERIMHEEHLGVREATIKAMEEVSGPVIAIVLVLGAVFLPVAALGGLTGELYKQFAVTIAVSVAISGIVALTLSPALARLLLRPSHGRKFIAFRWFDAVFGALTTVYAGAVRWTIRLGFVTALVFGALLWGTVHLFGKVPTGFLPAEDQGVIMVAAVLPDGASLDRTSEVVHRVEAYFDGLPEVEDVITLAGQNILASSSVQTNAASFYVTLKPWEERADPAAHASRIIARAAAFFAAEQAGVVFTFNPPSIPGLGTRAGFEFQLQSRTGGDLRELGEVNAAFLQSLRQRPELAGVSGTLSLSLPQLFVDVDQNRAKALAIPINDVFNSLQAFLGALYVNDFDKFGRVWRVQLQAEPEFRRDPENIGAINVRTGAGSMVGLSEVLTTRFQSGPSLVSRFNGFSSVQITGAPAPGFSTGQAMRALREAAAELPAGYSYEWSGQSFQEIKAGGQAPLVIAAGMLVVFLVLAAQYERWAMPLAVLLAVPLGIFGSLLAVALRAMPQDVYFQIGLLTLVGLASKNAILIVEFCMALRRQGRATLDAAIESARLRFRPIVMTSLAFILGVIPLVRASGAGAASQNSIGTGVMGGMIAATALAVFFVPFFYFVVQRATEILRPGAAPDPAGSGDPDPHPAPTAP